MSVNRVKQLEAQGVLSREASLDENRERYIRHMRAVKGGQGPQKERLDAARAALAEQELAVRERRLVPATDQDRVVIALTSVTSSRLLGLSTALAPELAVEGTVEGCARIVAAGIEEALSDLAGAGREAVARAGEAVAAGGEAEIH